MGISSDGQLSYGIPFDEEMEFPWSEYEDGGIDEWWEKVNGYQPLFQPFGDDGDYAPGFSKDDPRIQQEFDNRCEWNKQNPLPIELVLYCSYDYPMYLISVSNLNYSVNRGYFEKIPKATGQEENEARKIIIEFCQKYGISMPCEPDWYLTSLYG